MSLRQKAFELLTREKNLSGSELGKKLGVSERTGRRYKAEFEKLGLNSNFSVDSPVISNQILNWQTEQEKNTLDLEQLFDVITPLMQTTQLSDPVFTTDTLNFNTNEAIAVVFVSCMHLGSRYTSYEEFRKFFKHVLTIPRLYWASLGDEIEGFLPNFRDQDAINGQLNLKVQHVLLESVFKKLIDANKLLLGVASQHGTDWELRHSGKSTIKKLYLDHNIPFYDGMCYLKFVVGTQVYNIALSHEFPGFSMWNPLHPHKRALHFNFPFADVILMGDKHKAAVMDTEAYGWEYEAGNRSSRRCLLVQVGTAKTGPDKFTIKGWSKGEFEWPVLVFSAREHKIKWSWDLKDAEFWLNGGV